MCPRPVPKGVVIYTSKMKTKGSKVKDLPFVESWAVAKHSFVMAKGCVLLIPAVDASCDSVSQL